MYDMCVREMANTVIIKFLNLSYHNRANFIERRPPDDQEQHQPVVRGLGTREPHHAPKHAQSRFKQTRFGAALKINFNKIDHLRGQKYLCAIFFFNIFYLKIQIHRIVSISAVEDFCSNL